MAKKLTLEQMFEQTRTVTQETVARTGARTNEHTTGEAQRTRETVARTGARMNDHTTGEAQRTRETVARTGARMIVHTTDEAQKTRETVARTGARMIEHTTGEATRVMGHVDANHDDTRRVIREEHDRTRNALRDVMEWPEILMGLILGIIAGIGMWFAEKDVILKPVRWDAAGNVLKYDVDTFMVIVLAVLLGTFVFFVVTWIVHAIRKRY
jgi:hypothetical protein